MANNNMTDEKRARLEAIRAANKNRKVDTNPETQEPTAVTEAHSALAAQPRSLVSDATKAGSAMSDEKAARLAAIRAANVTKKPQPTPSGDSLPVTRATPPANPVPTTPVSPDTSGSRAKSEPSATQAAKVPAATGKQLATPASRSLTMRDIIMRVTTGIIIGSIIFALLATTEGNILPASICGAFLGAIIGYLFGCWPPSLGEETTE